MLSNSTPTLNYSCYYSFHDMQCALCKSHPFLFHSDASFSESLYGLRRRTVTIRAKKDDARPNSGDGIHHSGLEKHQKVLSVVFLVQLLLLSVNGKNIYSYLFI